VERFELPDAITTPDDGELSALFEGAVAAFDSLSTSDRVSSDDLAELRRLSAGVNDIRTEQQSRRDAAEAAAEAQHGVFATESFIRHVNHVSAAADVGTWRPSRQPHQACCAHRGCDYRYRLAPRPMDSHYPIGAGALTPVQRFADLEARA
jgi:hypothetical protein